MVECPHCAGEGGTKDYFGEWSECPCCNEAGQVSQERLDAYNAELAALDAEIERLVAGEGMERV